MSIPVLGSDSKAYQVAQATLGSAPSSSGILIALPTDHNLATSANIATLSAQITGALAPTGGLPVTLTGTSTVALASGTVVTANLGTLNGAATATLQTAANTSLASILAALPASLGAKASAASLSIAPASDATFPVSGTVAVSNLPSLGPKASSGSVSVTTANDAVFKTAPQSAAPRVTATGSLGAANASVSLPLDGMNTAIVQLTGTWVGTVSWSASVDGGTTYFPVNLIPYGGGAASPTVTANGQWELACGGLTHLQAQMTTYTSGSATALLAAAVGAKSVRASPVVAFTTAQIAVAIPAFVSGNTAGTGGTNATVTLAVTTSQTQRFLSIDNTGTADAEVWFGTRPADASVGQTPKQGKPLPAGAGLFFDVAVPAGTPIYVTAASATGLSVVTG